MRNRTNLHSFKCKHTHSKHSTSQNHFPFPISPPPDLFIPTHDPELEFKSSGKIRERILYPLRITPRNKYDEREIGNKMKWQPFLRVKECVCGWKNSLFSVAYWYTGEKGGANVDICGLASGGALKTDATAVCVGELYLTCWLIRIPLQFLLERSPVTKGDLLKKGMG